MFAAAIATLGLIIGSSWSNADTVRDLEQGWTPKIRQAFYTTPQGSHLIPLKFARALVEPATGIRFFAGENLKQFGFIPQTADANINPYGFPVGITIDGYTPLGQRQLGMNCAACHTNNLTHGGVTFRVDGGQSLLNFQAFINAMDHALFESAASEKNLKNFIIRAQKFSETKESPIDLRKEFEFVLAQRKEWRSVNTSNVIYGNGRTDAFGVIFNQVLARATRTPDNAHEPNAPVSYPVLWDTPYHDFVQWNGGVNNSAAANGPLARNMGQVLGVFGHIDVFNRTEIFGGYCNSARRRNLDALEKWTRSLSSPRWPANFFGTIDVFKAARGHALYQQNCVGCHAVLVDTRSPNRSVKAVLVPAAYLGVDPLLGLNSGRLAKSGPLEGRRTKIVFGRMLGALEPATVLLSHVVAGAIVGSVSAVSCRKSIDGDPESIAKGWLELVKNLGTEISPDPFEHLPAAQRNYLVSQAVARLKARPLNGIWASPPFLHNGSVQSLYELLLPAKDRAAQFTLGCTDFDPQKMGYVCGTVENAKGRSHISVVDGTIPGSLNTGHEYASALTDSERYDLLEYLKTL